LAVRIRLTRVGATKRPSYRVVAIDGRRPRDGRALEILGFYDPLTDPATVDLDADRIRGWLQRGASPSETVVRLMRQAGMPEAGKAPVPTVVEEKPKPRSKAGGKKSEAKATAKDEAPAEAPAEGTEGTPVEESDESSDETKDEA
jgi:small subunit ribosomal protein S16